MTNVPEVTLAREAGLCYANLSLVTNFAAGISSHTLTHREVVEVMGKKIDLIREIFMETAVSVPAAKNVVVFKRGLSFRQISALLFYFVLG